MQEDSSAGHRESFLADENILEAEERSLVKRRGKGEREEVIDVVTMREDLTDA